MLICAFQPASPSVVLRFQRMHCDRFLTQFLHTFHMPAGKGYCKHISTSSFRYLFPLLEWIFEQHKNQHSRSVASVSAAERRVASRARRFICVPLVAGGVCGTAGTGTAHIIHMTNSSAFSLFSTLVAR